MYNTESMPSENNNDNLRLYIKRLEEWPDSNPPTPSELREIRKEINLSIEERDKLEELADNHIRRARRALRAKAYAQAAAELSRAAQLRPLSAQPRTELAEIYLQRSLERGYRRTDRQKALQLAQKALELEPGNKEAKQFLQEYRQMNADFRSVRYRKYIIPGLIVLALLVFFSIRHRDWIMKTLQLRQEPAISNLPKEPEPLPTHQPREIKTQTSGTKETGINMEITHSETGRRNEAPFVDIQGRLNPLEEPLQSVNLLLNGQDSSGNQIFSIPLTIGGAESPLIYPKETLPFSIYKYLQTDDSLLNSLELKAVDAKFIQDLPPVVPEQAEVVWKIPQPEATALNAQVRNTRCYEAYDRQVLLMELALTNSGTKSIGNLELEISMDSKWKPFRVHAVSPNEPGFERSECRVWNVIMDVPLTENALNKPVTVKVVDAGL